MSASDFVLVGQWLLEVSTMFWTALGGWGFLGFAVIFFPVMRRLVRLFRSVVQTIT